MGDAEGTLVRSNVGEFDLDVEGVTVSIQVGKAVDFALEGNQVGDTLGRTVGLADDGLLDGVAVAGELDGLQVGRRVDGDALDCRVGVVVKGHVCSPKTWLNACMCTCKS